MDNKYLVLQKLSELVQEAPQPTLYQCIPRQLILLLPFDWTTIHQHLVSLEAEGWVVLTQADNVQFSVTQEGLNQAASLETNNQRTACEGRKLV